MDPEKTNGEPEPIRLLTQWPLGRGKFELDAAAGLFKNVSILTRGPAIGHGFDIDDTMLRQVRDALKRKGRGVKARLTHPEAGGLFGGGTDGIECLVGRAGANAHLDDGQVRGDVQLGGYARNTPKGDLWSYLTAIGAEDPEFIGLSIVFIPDEFAERRDEHNQSLPPAGRVRDVLAVDFVGDPGANPAGLLAAGEQDKRNVGPGGTGGQVDHGKAAPGVGGSRQAADRQDAVAGTQGAGTMPPILRTYLELIGLEKEASDEQANAYLAKLTPEQKLVADQLAAKPAEPEPAPEPKDPPAGEPAGLEAKIAEKIAAERKAESDRLAMLAGLAETHGLGEKWVREQFTAGTDEPAALKLALAAYKDGNKPLADIQVGDDRNVASLTGGIGDAILLKAGRPLIEFDSQTNRALRDGAGQLQYRKPHGRAPEFRVRSMTEIMRQYLAVIGVPGTGSMGPSRLIELSLHPQRLRAAYGGAVALASSSDFPYILEDAMGKSLRTAYEEAPSTWQIWAKRNTAADFKDIKRVALSAAPDLAERDEGGEVTYANLSETRETYALVEYAKGIRLTRRAIINDDLDAFGRIPMLQGRSAKRKEDDVVYAILTANAAMGEDSVALFHETSHANIAASGGAPSVATWNAGAAAMAIQTDISAVATLNLAPRFILAPAALAGTVRELLASPVNPAATAVNVTNIWQGALTPVIEARLDANSTTMWYLAADSGVIDTVEISFLADEQAPVLKTETVFDTDDVKYAVRHTCAAKAIDYRGLYANPGA